MNKFFVIPAKPAQMFVLVLCLIFLSSQVAFGQQKYHEANDLHLVLFGTGHFFNEWHIPNATATYPAGWVNRDNLVYYSPSLITDTDVMLDGGATGERGVWPGNSQENNNTPVSIRKVWRYRPPSVTVDNVLLTPIFEDEVDPTIAADEMIEIQWVINSEPGQGYPGVAITQKSYSYVNENHSQYVIFDLNYEYTQQVGPDPSRFIPDQPLDAWLATVYGFSVCKFGAQVMDTWGYLGGWDLQDDMATHMIVSNPYSTVRDELVISYTYDDDSPDMPGDDMGDPDPELGTIASPQYMGFATLHTDMSAGDESDDPSNPTTVGIKQMDELWYDNPDDGITWFTAGTREENSDIITLLPSHYQVTKQYHFEKDDDVHTVHVLAAASAITAEEAVTYGDQYISGTLSDAEKNAILSAGRDSLVEVIQRAAWAWENNLAVPAPPPSPDLTVTSGPSEINLDWSDVSTVPDPATSVVDFAGYRVYRAIGQKDTSYTQIWEGMDNSYTDTDVTRGVAYHYFVTAFDNGSQNTAGLNPGQSMESSRHLNRTSEPAQAFQPGAANTKNVVVVPNPHDRSGEAVNYPGDITQKNKIQFFNLPPVCTIRIYTATGKLIKTIQHSSGSGDESWDLITSFNQYVASGIYIFRVDDAKTWEGQSLESSFGKFVVIR